MLGSTGAAVPCDGAMSARRVGNGEMRVETEAERGYQDAIRHVTRALEHRRHKLEEADPGEFAGGADERRARIDEIEHLMEVIRSLKR